jgi:hypothetical protein
VSGVWPNRHAQHHTNHRAVFAEYHFFGHSQQNYILPKCFCAISKASETLVLCFVYLCFTIYIERFKSKVECNSLSYDYSNRCCYLQLKNKTLEVNSKSYTTKSSSI